MEYYRNEVATLQREKDESIKAHEQEEQERSAHDARLLAEKDEEFNREVSKRVEEKNQELSVWVAQLREELNILRAAEATKVAQGNDSSYAKEATRIQQVITSFQSNMQETRSQVSSIQDHCSDVESRPSLNASECSNIQRLGVVVDRALVDRSTRQSTKSL